MLDPHIAENYEQVIADLDAQGVNGAAHLRDLAVKNDWPAVVEWLDQRAPKVEDATAGPTEKAVRKGK